MQSLFKLSVMVSAIDKLTAPVKKMMGTVASFEKMMQRARGVTEFGQRMGISAAMIGEGANKGKAAMTGLLEPFVAVEDGLAWLSLSTTTTKGSMERSMEATKNAARDWSKMHADNARTFIEASSVFSGAGLNDVQAIEGTRAALTLGKATMGTAAEAADIMTDSYENFGNKSRDAAAEMNRLADVMAMTQNLFKFRNLGQLAEGLRNAAPAAIQSRASFEELNVVVGALNNTSLAGAPAGTAYAATMRQMLKASRDLGFEIAKNENGGISMIGTLANMREQFGDFSLMSDDLKMAFQTAFGDEGMKLVMLLGGKVDSLNESMKAMDSAAGTAAAGMARLEKNTSSRWKVINNNIENAKELLGEKLLPVIDKVLPKVLEMVDGFSGFIEANPELAQAVVITAALGTGLMMVVAPLLSVASGLMILTGYGGMGLTRTVQGIVWLKNALSGGAITAKIVSIGSGLKSVTLSGWRLLRMAGSLSGMLVKLAQTGLMLFWRSLLTVIPAVWSFTVALLANPLTWIILGIVALGGALYACVVYWDDIRYAAVTAWAGIVAAWGAGVTYIQTSLDGALAWAVGIGTSFFASGAALWLAFTDGIRSRLAGPVIAVQAGLEPIRGAAAAAWVWIGDVWDSGIASIEASISGALASINNLTTTFFASGAALWDAFTAGIRSALFGPVEAVQVGLQSVRNLLPFSDAKEGPLSQLTRSGQALMETLAEGARIEAPRLHDTVSEGLDIGGFVQRLSDMRRQPEDSREGTPGRIFQINQLIIKVEKMDSVESFTSVMKQIAAEVGGDA